MLYAACPVSAASGVRSNG